MLELDPSSGLGFLSDFKEIVPNRIDDIVHPLTQVIGKLAAVDILDLPKVAWTNWGYFYNSRVGMGLPIVKNLDP